MTKRYDIDKDQTNAFFNITLEESSNTLNTKDMKKVDVSAKTDHCHIYQFHPLVIFKSDMNKKEDVDKQLAEIWEKQKFYRIQFWFDRNNLSEIFLRDLYHHTPDLDSRYIYGMKMEVNVNGQIIQTIQFVGALTEAVILEGGLDKDGMTCIFNAYEISVKDEEGAKQLYGAQMLKEFQGSVQ